MAGDDDGSADRLATYRQKRDARRTPEPVPAAGPLPEGNDDTFVIQEHHARRLHWDVRLERAGVLVSWAVPKGLPLDPHTNHLAVHTEDHPLEYASFAGDIPSGEYGGGQVYLWDRGHYELEKWTDREVKVVFHGSRAQGRYVFFRTRGDDWMVHRMDPPADPDWRPVPTGLRAMRPVHGDLPPAAEDGDWRYDLAWGGERVIVAVSGGRSVPEVDGVDVSALYPELRSFGPSLGSRACVLDGTVVALDEAGRPDPDGLRRRRELGGPTAIRRAAAEAPVTLLLGDVLHLDGHDTTSLSLTERRALLRELPLDGQQWGLPPEAPASGAEAMETAVALGLDGVVAKRRESPYRPGERSPDWRLVTTVTAWPVVIGGWIPAAAGEPVALLVGMWSDGKLAHVGTVRTGLTADRRAEVAAALRSLERKTSPFIGAPADDGARWVRASVVGEVTASGWTRDERLRRPAWRGLRPDVEPRDVRF